MKKEMWVIIITYTRFFIDLGAGKHKRRVGRGRGIARRAGAPRHTFCILFRSSLNSTLSVSYNR